MKTVSNSDDIIDSRDVVRRIADLEHERDAYEPSDAPELAGQILQWGTEYPDDAAELAALLALQEEAEGCAPDWYHGCTLIRDSYFTDYARQYAEDVCELPTSWPASCIDWKQAADELQDDYTAVEFDGVTYLVR